MRNSKEKIISIVFVIVLIPSVAFAGFFDWLKPLFFWEQPQPTEQSEQFGASKVAPLYGGTGQDSSTWTGVAQVSSGTWSADNLLSVTAVTTTDLYVSGLMNIGGVAAGNLDMGNYRIFAIGSASSTFDSAGGLIVNSSSTFVGELSVMATTTLSGALVLTDQAGTSGQYLQSQGTSTAPIWIDLAGSPWTDAGTYLNPTNGEGLIVSASSTFSGNLSVGTSTSKFIVNSDTGYVGIGSGTTIPAAPLDVRGTGIIGAAIDVVNSGTAISNIGGLTISNANITTDNYVGVLFSDNVGAVSGASGAIGMQLTDRTNHYGDLVFITRNGEFIEGMRIMSGGNVGIGTSTPMTTFSVTGDARISGNVTTTGNFTVIDRLKFNDTDFNTLLGYTAGTNLVTGAQYNTFMGYQAGSGGVVTTAADNNVGIGYWTLLNLTSGTMNVAIGNQALRNVSSGQRNMAMGNQALVAVSTGHRNTAIGALALANAAGAVSDNVAIGDIALTESTGGNRNTAIGSAALWANAGNNNVAIGYRAGGNETGDNSFYVGNANQANLANDRAYSLLYGTFSGTAASLTGQKLTVNGNFGISTTTPGALLAATSTYSQANVLIGDDQGTRFIIDSSGNVGIGTSTPAYTLDVWGSLAVGTTTPPILLADAGAQLITLGADMAVGTLQIDADSGVVTLVDMSVTSGASMGTIESYSFNIDASSTPAMTIYSESDGSGGIRNMRVGIATSTPNARLHIFDQYATSTMFISSGVAGKGGQIILEDSDGVGCTKIIANNGVLTASIATCP